MESDRTRAGANNQRPGRLRGRAGGARLWASMVAITVVSGALAAQADAYLVEVKNETNNQIRFSTSGAASCWDMSNRDFPTLGTITSNPTVARNSVGKFEAGGPSYGLEGGCLFKPGYRGIAMSFQDSTGTFRDPRVDGDPYPYDQFQLAFRDGRPRLEGAFDRWLPANPLQAGSSVGSGAGGGFCIVDARNKKVATVKVAVEFTVTDNLARCNSAHRIDTAPLSAPAEPALGATTTDRQAPSKESGVVSMFDIGTALCKKVRMSLSWTRDCGEVGTQSNWDLTRIDADVRKMALENKVQPSVGWTQVGNALIYKNTTNDVKQIPYNLSFTSGTRTQKDHCFSFKFGQKFETKVGGKIGLPFVTEGGIEVTVGIDTEENWSDCSITETNTQVTNGITFPIDAKPNGVTQFRVLQGAGDMLLNYTADLTFGRKNTAQALKTPLTRALGMSPARIQPCVGYLAGAAKDSDPYSLIGIGQQLQAQGISASSFNIDPELGRSLGALSNFKQAGDDRCPGWSSGYPASMVFQGNAGIRLNTLGAGADEAPWAPGIGTLKPVEFFEPFSTPSAAKLAPAAAGASRDQIVDGDDSPAARRLVGNDDSNLIIADDDRAAETMIGKDGLDILEGAGGRQVMLGGDDLDVLTGEGGDDDLDGGPGSDSLYGGEGDDEIRDDSGDNRILGGGGRDLLTTSGDAVGGLLGEGGDDRLVLAGEGPIGLTGGKGDDTYVLRNGANPLRATESPGDGEDTVVASGEIEVPPAIERVEALDGAKVRIDAGEGSQTLVGGPENDDLAGGPGADEMLGKGGDDDLRLDEWDFDDARGGPGADTFTPIATPQTAPLGPGFELPAKPTAHLIEDFAPAEGDRLMLRKTSFGPEVSELGARMRVREGVDPRARGRSPQLLFATRSSLLRYDSDGRGSKPSQVVAILDGFSRLPVAGIAVPADSR